MAGRRALFGNATLRRGRATSDVFARAKSCVRRSRSLLGHADIMRGDSRTIDTDEPCSVDEALAAFEEAKRARMIDLGGGRYAFTISHPHGDDRYELTS